MNLHEFQAKQILQKYGIPIPEFYVVFFSLEEWKSFSQKKRVAIGSAKSSSTCWRTRVRREGVKIAHSLEAILQAAKELLGKKIINEQTGPGGMVGPFEFLSPHSSLYCMRIILG